MLSDLEVFKAVLAKATCPEDVFGPVTGATPQEKHAVLRKAYHQVARVVHPDRYADNPNPKVVALASDLFSQLTTRMTEARAKIDAGTYGNGRAHVAAPPPGPPMTPQVIQASKRKYIVTDVLTHGDLADVYLCSYTEGSAERRAAFKLAQSAADNDLLENEQKTLSTIYPPGQAEVKSYRYLPKLLDSFLLRTEHGGNRRVNILELADGYVSVAEVMKAYTVGLDLRDMAWMFKRALAALWFVHTHHKMVHGAILPEHILVHPTGHGAKIVDWCYAVKIGERVKAISKAGRAYYAPEVLSKAPATAKTDIYMLGKCMTALLGSMDSHSNARAARSFLKTLTVDDPGRRPDDAGQLHEEFDELLHRLVGERVYRPLAMPAKV